MPEMLLKIKNYFKFIVNMKDFFIGNMKIIDKIIY